MKLGPGAENSSVKVGDRVGVKWVSGTCGSCRMSPFPFPLPAFSFPSRKATPGRCYGQEGGTVGRIKFPSWSTDIMISSLPRGSGRTMSQGESERLLHSRDIPAVLSRSGQVKLLDPSPPKFILLTRLTSTATLLPYLTVLSPQTQL